VTESVLLGARNHPAIAISHRRGLQTTDITSSECFADGQANKLLAGQNLWDNLGLDLVRAEVDDRRETNNTSCKEAINVPAAAAASKLKV
jgi:hypothetical protein